MSSSNTSKYLIVGGGVTAANAADSIRQVDKDGSITILGLEPHLPYDRPPLTKEYLQDDTKKVADVLSRAESFYKDNAIGVHQRARVTNVDTKARSVTTERGQIYGYEKLLLATGASPNTLDVPGAGLKGVKVLRWVDESQDIRDALSAAKSVVLVGAGYIGMEVAASILKRGEGAKVTIIDPGRQPWSRVASPKLGAYLQTYFSTRGVDFKFGQTVTEFVGNNKTLIGVKTDRGDTIDADLAVVGIGVKLETALAKAAGLNMDDKEGVYVDKHLRTSDPHVWAAGDIAYFDDIAMGQRWHLEHYMNATWQGEFVGQSMAGVGEAFNKVPYFFSDMGDLHMVLRGNIRKAGETRLLGDPAKNRFVELYPNSDGIVQMIVAISENQAELEALAEKYEPIIRAQRNITEIDESEVGV